MLVIVLALWVLLAGNQLSAVVETGCRNQLSESSYSSLTRSVEPPLVDLVCPNLSVPVSLSVLLLYCDGVGLRQRCCRCHVGASVGVWQLSC